MNSEAPPVVLELAPLPREQIGPFLLLGLDKDADAEQIEANWAKRVIWARKKQTRVALEDINWAREVINDPDRRLHAHAVSLNVDTADATLRQLAHRYEMPSWHPIEPEESLAGLIKPLTTPDLEEIERSIAAPERLWNLPPVDGMLKEMLGPSLDPWKDAG